MTNEKRMMPIIEKICDGIVDEIKEAANEHSMTEWDVYQGTEEFGFSNRLDVHQKLQEYGLSIAAASKYCAGATKEIERRLSH